MSANDRQEGGNHYIRVPGEMLWDRLVRIYGLEQARTFFIGTILSYVERYQFKGGVLDLKKAAHFLEKLIELEEEHARKASPEELPEPQDAGNPTLHDYGPRGG